jgi:hypothetical protein
MGLKQLLSSAMGSQPWESFQMKIEEVSLYLELSPSLCLDIKVVEAFPGYVRSVYLRERNRVVVEYEQYGFDEGGAYFYADYDNLTSAVSDLENYLARPITQWRSLSPPANYPLVPGLVDVSEGTRRLASAIANESVPLPNGAVYELRGSSYWLRYKESSGLKAD